MTIRRLLVSVSLAVVVLGGLSASAVGKSDRPAGYRILLASNRDGKTRAYSVLPDGSRLTPLLPHGQALEPVSLSRDGSTVAYQDRHFGFDVSRADGTGLRALKVQACCGGVLSRDGKLIAFSDEGGIKVVGTDGRGLRRLTSGEDHAPDWSPQGEALVFVRTFESNRRPQVVVQPLRGKSRVLVRSESLFTPKWSPDGRWIAYLDRSGLWVVQPNGAHRHRIPAGADEPFAWSPDGRRIATFSKYASHVLIASVEGHALKRLRVSVTWSGDPPVWSPDGRRLVLTGHVGDDPNQIWIVGSDGRGLRRVTSSGTNEPFGWTRLAPRLAPALSLPPSEHVIGAQVLATRAPVVGLSADGPRVAVVTDATPTDCRHITVWTPAKKSLLRLSPRLQAPCPEYGVGGMYGVQLAGTRVGWIEVVGCGNSCDIALESATLAQPLPREATVQPGAFESDAEEGTDDNLRGDGDLLVFDDASYDDTLLKDARLVRIGGAREHCSEHSEGGGSFCALLRKGEHAAPVDSVSAGRIAIRERDAVAVLDAKGDLVRLFPFASDDVSAARLDGGRLVVARLAVLESYDIATGERESSQPLPSGSKLTDVDGGVAVLQSGKAIILLRLADGRSYALPNHAQLADLEAPGLYYSYTTRKEGRVVFVPRADVERQLGS